MGKKNDVKILYLLISIPVLVASVILVILIPSLRAEYRHVQSSIVTHPHSEFEILLVDLLTVAEDHRYRSHFGFDVIAIGRALWRFFTSKKIEGASTLEQQLVRTITKKYRVTLRRKIEEIAVSLLVSLNNNKDDIAYTYLSVAYFGSDITGYKAASEVLELGESLQNCRITHGAGIVSLLKRPRPVIANPSWKKRHNARQKYIMKKYISLTS